MLVKWRAVDFPPEGTECTYVHSGLTNLEPLECSRKYFPDFMFDDLARYTNMYALQSGMVELGTTSEEIRVFFGVLMRMAVLKFPHKNQSDCLCNVVQEVPQASNNTAHH